VPRWLGLLSAVCLLACMTTTFAQTPGSQISIYAVEGLALGARIPFDSSAYREYKCSPSDQFDGFTWCQQTRQQGERRRSSDVTYSLLHSRDGSIVYINRYQTPAFFGRNEAEHDIQSYSQKLGESPEQRYGCRTDQEVLSRFVLELGDAISGISRVPSQAARSIG
jgi:hypothetical protein